MALVQCQECGSEVSTEADACPRCGHADPAGTTAAKKQQRKDTWLGCAVMGCGIPILGLLLMAGFGLLLESDSDGSPEPSRAGSIVACEGMVEERLKAPSTAEFHSETFLSAGGGTYRVRGEVDAENAFGAKIRNDFRCTIERNAQGEWAHELDYIR